MTVWIIVLIGLGAGVGAVCRYLVSLLFYRSTSSVFPWGTWFVNLVGTLAFGLLLLVPVQMQNRLLWQLLGPGFCGGFTTFSTMVQETVSMFRTHRVLGIVYITTSIGGGLLISGLISIAFSHRGA